MHIRDFYSICLCIPYRVRPTGVVPPYSGQPCSDLCIQLGSHLYFTAFRGGHLDPVALAGDLEDVRVDRDNFSLEGSN